MITIGGNRKFWKNWNWNRKSYPLGNSPLPPKKRKSPRRAGEKCLVFLWSYLFTSTGTEQTSPLTILKPMLFTFCSLSSALLILWFTGNWHRRGLWLITWSDIDWLSIDRLILITSTCHKFYLQEDLLFVVSTLFCLRERKEFMLTIKEIFVGVDDDGDHRCILEWKGPKFTHIPG